MDSLTQEQRQLFQDLTEICEFKATSDLPDSWTEEERANLRHWLEKTKKSRRTGRYTFMVGNSIVDMTQATELPPRPRGFDSVLRGVVSWLGEQLWILKIWDFLLRTKPAQMKKYGEL